MAWKQQKYITNRTGKSSLLGLQPASRRETMLKEEVVRLPAPQRKGLDFIDFLRWANLIATRQSWHDFKIDFPFLCTSILGLEVCRLTGVTLTQELLSYSYSRCHCSDLVVWSEPYDKVEGISQLEPLRQHKGRIEERHTSLATGQVNPVLLQSWL